MPVTVLEPRGSHNFRHHQANQSQLPLELWKKLTCSVVALQVGAALEELLAEGVVTREQLFITTKLWWMPLAAQAYNAS